MLIPSSCQPLYDEYSFNVSGMFLLLLYKLITQFLTLTVMFGTVTKTARQVESSQILDSIADQSVAVNENVKDTVPEDKVNVMELKVQVNQLTEIESSLKAENEELKLEVIQLKEIIGCLQTGVTN